MIYWIFLNRTNDQGRRGESANKQTTSPNFWPLCSRTDHCFLSGSQYSKWLPLVFGHWLPGLQQTAHNLANFAGESPSFYTFRLSIRSDLRSSCFPFVTTFVYCFSCLSLPEFSRKVSFPSPEWRSATGETCSNFHELCPLWWAENKSLFPEKKHHPLGFLHVTWIWHPLLNVATFFSSSLGLCFAAQYMSAWATTASGKKTQTILLFLCFCAYYCHLIWAHAHIHTASQWTARMK